MLETGPTIIEEEYGLISLFDGTGTTYATIAEENGYDPTFFIAAEYEPAPRFIVADKHGLNIDHTDPVWRPNKYGVPSRYLKDVWELLHDHGQLLKEIGILFPNCRRIVVVAGSPCQDLTYMNAWKGLLGILGPRSKHFQIIPVFLIAMEILLPRHRISLIIENAGSMRPIHREFILAVIGLPPAAVKQIDAGTWGPVRRNRLFMGNTIGFDVPGPSLCPWEVGWRVSQHKEACSYALATRARSYAQRKCHPHIWCLPPHQSTLPDRVFWRD